MTKESGRFATSTDASRVLMIIFNCIENSDPVKGTGEKGETILMIGQEEEKKKERKEKERKKKKEESVASL